MMRRPAEARLDPVLDFLRLLWDVEHRLQSASKHMRTAIGITGPQRLVLIIVSLSPGLSAGELARTVRLHPSTITGIVQRLVAKGFLIRDVDPVDTRRVRLRVADRARPLTRPSGGTVEAAVKQTLAGVPRSYVEHARTVLSTLASALHANGALAPPRKSIVRRSRRGQVRGEG
jgi:MarR family transcriptional regulator, organic hydroperoxide resistance regulator